MPRKSVGGPQSTSKAHNGLNLAYMHHIRKGIREYITSIGALGHSEPSTDSRGTMQDRSTAENYLVLRRYTLYVYEPE